MNKLFNNRILDAFAKLLFISAAIHMSLYGVIYLMGKSEKGLLLFNYFDIIDLDLFFPELINGFGMFIISQIVTLIIFLIIYFKFTQK